MRCLKFIRSAQTAGFTLEQIEELLSLDASENQARARQLAAERLAALGCTITDLEAARTALWRLARTCAAKHSGSCPITDAFQGNAV